MKKLVIGLLSTSVVLACVGTVLAQRGRVTAADLRSRQQQRHRGSDDPANNPFRVEPYEPLKPATPKPSAIRATVELQVVGTENGDTLFIINTANQRLRLRLQGIDAPEAGQSYFDESRANLAKLVSGKSVAIEFDPHGKPDREGRVVAKVYLDGKDVALDQVNAGFAWYCKDYKKLQSESDRYTYAAAEKEARTKGIGLWRDPSPLAPWDHRKQ